MSGSPQFDVSATAAQGTGNFSYTHTPVWSVDAILVWVVQAAATDDQVSSVTYGGETMTRIGDLIVDAGAEVGRIYLYRLFRGTDTIPSGAQTVAVTVSGAADKKPYSYSYHAGGANVELITTATLDVDATADPSVDLILSSSKRAALAYMLLSGRNSGTGFAPGAGWITAPAGSAVFGGAQICVPLHWKKNGAHGNALGPGTFPANCTFGADEQAILAVAIGTVSSGDEAEFDASSESEANPTATGDFNWSHPGAAADVKGVAIVAIQNSTAADQVSGATYGGDALTEVDLSPYLKNFGEQGTISVFFKGSGVAQGTQTAAVTVSGAQVKHGFCITWTAYDDMEVHDTNTADFSTATATPSVDTSIAAAVEAALIAFWHGGPNVNQTGAGADHQFLFGGDFGNQTTSLIRRVANVLGAQTANISWGTIASDDYGVFGLAVRQVPSSIVIVGLTSESDSSLAAGRLKTAAAGLTSETNTAFAVTHSKGSVAGLASESGVSQPVNRLKTATIGLPTTSEIAFDVTIPSSTIQVGQALETSAAFAATAERTHTAGLPATAETSFAVTGSKLRSVGAAGETNIASPAAAGEIHPVGLASESDSTFALTWSKSLTCGLAVEIDFAFASTYTGGGGGPPPPLSYVPPCPAIYQGIIPAVKIPPAVHIGE